MDFDCPDGGGVQLNRDFSILSKINFLIANKNKLMQRCLQDDKTLDLKLFEIVFHAIMENKITTALGASIRLTAIILDILDINNIKH